ncbi:MAG TPA: hypothetical protein VGS23_04230 [Thermoplasmata archaeon]|nr:hypothetical protein [Thermoplasmata archaeon]
MSGADLCPKCGRLADDHLCLTRAELDSLVGRVVEEKTSRFTRLLQECEEALEKVKKYRHVLVDRETAYSCRCGAQFTSLHEFNTHIREEGP